MPDEPGGAMKPIAWTVGGSDSGGGAGIQADVVTMNRLGVHACSIITCVTAQSTRNVAGIEPVSPEMLEAQFDALLDDLPPAAVKIGMLGTAETVSRVASRLNRIDAFVVCDPVMKASTSHALLEPEALAALKDELLPRIDLLTPNVPEAESLLGRRIETDADAVQAAMDLCALGPASVLLKGGHRAGEWSQDVWTNRRQTLWLTSLRQSGAERHGTGCVLSSAVAACRARGYSLTDALVIAKAFVNQGLRSDSEVGTGPSPVTVGAWPRLPEDLPWITDSAEAGRTSLRFPPLENRRIGLYPIVDRLDLLRELLPHGLSMIQLRIKDAATPGLEKMIAEAISVSRAAQVNLVVNDHWEAAIRHGAYGVHFGQDDLDPAALRTLSHAGMRLGISTHSYSEVARARAVEPSYIAIGTVFPTTSKVMEYAPLGLEEFARLRALVACPVVAIGGIHIDNASAVRRAGADGMAVISEVSDSPNVSETVNAWRALVREDNEGGPG